MSNFSKFIFNKIMGWKITNVIPDLKKCVIVIAPHTSNWDFIVAKLAYSSIGRTANFLIKEDWFFFPFNLLFKSIGGIPVKRDKNTALTEVLTKEFKERESMQLGITPEGTRKPVEEWKKGFYFIAVKSEVPIVLIGLDYKKKEATFLNVFYPTGDYKKDIVEIKAFYKNITPKKPENFII